MMYKPSQNWLVYIWRVGYEANLNVGPCQAKIIKAKGKVPNKYPSNLPCLILAKLCLEILEFFSSKNYSEALFSMGCCLLDGS